MYCCVVLAQFNFPTHTLSFLQHVPALSGGAIMDNVSHLTNVVMDIKNALMAVMNWTVVSIVVLIFYILTVFKNWECILCLSYSILLRYLGISTQYVYMSLQNNGSWQVQGKGWISCVRVICYCTLAKSTHPWKSAHLLLLAHFLCWVKVYFNEYLPGAC